MEIKEIAFRTEEEEECGWCVSGRPRMVSKCVFRTTAAGHLLVKKVLPVTGVRTAD